MSGPHRDAPRPSETEQVERLGLWLHTHYPGWIHEKLEIGLLTNRWRAYAKTLYDLGVRIPGLGGSDAGVAARIEVLPPLQNLPLPQSLEGDSPERLLHELWAGGLDKLAASIAANARTYDAPKYDASGFRAAFERIAYRIVLDSATPEQLAALGLKVMVSK